MPVNALSTVNRCRAMRPCSTCGGRDAENGKLKAGRSLVRELDDVDGYDALVAAHDRALAAVSRDIATALRKLAFSR